jgi:DHA1 family L-arabinose/isopropyl-beta-D-thiogalactopyranoside export protein-like MFS transporter
MWRLLIVMLGAFVAQTSEYLPIGLLPEISLDLGVSESAVGALVTGYAWLAALTAVPLTLATNRLDRRWLFLGLLGVMTLANVLAALSPNYTVLAMMRIITALTHGVFWSILAAFATRLAPQMPTRRALAWAFGGISLAIVAGVPAATTIGQWAGWRAAFSTFAIIGLIIIVAGRLCFPAVKDKKQSIGRGFQRNNVPLYRAAIITMLIVAAHFCAYTYIVPLLDHVAGVQMADIPVLLLVFGCAGAVGTVIAGWVGRRPAILALTAAVGIVVSQVLMALGVSPLSFVGLKMILWGASISALIIGLQGWVLELVPEQPDAASAFYVTAFNFGIGAGAMVGGVILRVEGERIVLWTGTSLGVMAAMVLALSTLRHLRPSLEKRR